MQRRSQLPFFNPRTRLHREAIEKAFVVLTASGELHALRLARRDEGFELEEDPLDGRMNWKIRTAL
jgi:hypothetical protein